MESTLAGWQRTLFSLTSAAATYWGIMKPEFSPPSCVRKAGSLLARSGAGRLAPLAPRGGRIRRPSGHAGGGQVGTSLRSAARAGGTPRAGRLLDRFMGARRFRAGEPARRLRSGRSHLTGASPLPDV